MNRNMINKFVQIFLCTLLTPAFLCRGEVSVGQTRVAQEALPVPGDIHKYKAPLYWSIYEYAREFELAGIPYDQMDLSSDQWDAVIDMMATKFKPYGYDMICTDGFLPQQARDGGIYMSHYGSMPLKELIRRARAKGLKVGVYDNPLWIKGNLDSKVPGTDYTLRSLTRNPQDVVLYPEVTDRPDFTWLVTDHPGAREYIDGWFKHYHDLGVDFVRMDFMCWYEDGDPGRDYPVTCGYGRERYERGLAYICEAATKYGIFTSIVMPELYNDAELERKYCNMTRIVQDANIGGWHHFSSFNRGVIYDRWPYADNQMDGFTHWSHIGGRGKVILDGDFLRLNKCTTDHERRSQVSLQLIAGGPVAIADTPETIGDLDSFYTNTELLALNTDGFVGKPLSDEIGSEGSCIWWGTMSNGDVVLAMFNREDYSREMSVDLSKFGIHGTCRVRDMWTHVYENSISGTFSATVPEHGCKVVKLLPETAAKPESLYMIGRATPAFWNIDNACEMTVEQNTFVYRGPLFKGEVRFVSKRDWNSVNYIPKGDNGTWLTDPGVVEVFNGDPHEFAKNWWINEPGSYEVRMKISDSGNLASLSATRTGELPSMMTVLGVSTGCWNNVNAYIAYGSDDNPDIVEWNGLVRPDADRCHFKFAACPGEWWESMFYVPETVDFNNKVKLVKPGETHKYREDYGGGLDYFWGFAPVDCGFYRVTVNKAAKTVTFTPRSSSDLDLTETTAGANRLNAWFSGDILYAESGNGPVAVYDINGRCLGRSADGLLTIDGLAAGVYVVRNPSASIKLMKK